MRSVGLLIALSAIVASAVLASETIDAATEPNGPGRANPIPIVIDDPEQTTGTGPVHVLPLPGIIGDQEPTTPPIVIAPKPTVAIPGLEPVQTPEPTQTKEPIMTDPILTKEPFQTPEPNATVSVRPPDMTAPPTKCQVLPNKDRLGFDIGNTKGKLNTCDAACDKVNACQTWTWNDYEGGTCWLKSHAGKLLDKAGVSAIDCVVDRPSLVCNAYKDIDFVGMDIGNKPGKSFEDCCDICNEFSGCTAYAWNDYQGGTCWLKKSVGHVIYKAGVTSSSTVQLYGPVCPFESDVDFVGNDIGNKPAADAGVCCSLCKGNKDCKAYSWSKYNGGTCWMKSGKGKTVSASGVISAALAGF